MEKELKKLRRSILYTRIGVGIGFLAFGLGIKHLGQHHHNTFKKFYDSHRSNETFLDYILQRKLGLFQKNKVSNDELVLDQGNSKYIFKNGLIFTDKDDRNIKGDKTYTN